MTAEQLKKDIGITHSLHRLKLKLAIDEIVKVTTPGSNTLPTVIFIFLFTFSFLTTFFYYI